MEVPGTSLAVLLIIARVAMTVWDTSVVMRWRVRAYPQGVELPQAAASLGNLLDVERESELFQATAFPGVKSGVKLLMKCRNRSTLVQIERPLCVYPW
ncbi:MAG: hypothetical protein M0027_05415 [Candidatus Dormibacteraeota bacterium]|jgi:hypothetical protein|nr:hypothetical protein [Candidatus Dormibacteraeota bacterium]